MSRLIARCSRLGIHTRWLGGPALCLLALLLVVVSGVSDSPQGGGLPGPDFRLLSPPVPQPNGAWRVTWSSTSGKTYRLQRTANDELNAANWVDVATLVATGPVTYYDDSTVARQRFYRVNLVETIPAQSFTSDANIFVPLGSNGLPVEGRSITFGPDGLLGAFEFRPGGRSLLGLGQGFFIRFPAGARIVTSGGRKMIEFTSATAGFGPKSPFQLRHPLSVAGVSPQMLPLTELDVATVVAAFGLPQGTGLDVRLFGRFTLRMVSGVFAANGLRAGRIVLVEPALPLPQGENSYSGFTLELEADGGIRLPFSGSFGFDDGSGNGARLTVPPTRPLWLELRADGGVSLGGRVELKFSPGPEFSADLLFDDPNYELSLSAKGLHFSLLNSLNLAFPPVPTVPENASDATLTQVTEKFRCYQKALDAFNSITVADTPYEAGDTASSPPETVAGPATALDAWGYAALCGSGQEPAMDATPLKTVLHHAGQAASAARPIKSVLDLRLALVRIQLAFAKGLPGFAPIGFASGDRRHRL